MNTSILWLRRDLRLSDNPALCRALQANSLLPVYIDDEEENAWPMGSASRWWLHHSLSALDGELRKLGSRLIVRRGPSLGVLREIARQTKASGVFWNRCYEPAAIQRDTEVKQALRNEGLTVESFNSALWHEPWTIVHGKEEPYRVFTPYWKVLQKRGWAEAPMAPPLALPGLATTVEGLAVAELGLLPKIAWDAGLQAFWQPGEAGAFAKLEDFVESAVATYADRRDRPDQPGTSRLAPHLHFGEISPRQIAWALQSLLLNGESGAECLMRELAWREFAHHLLYHFPHTPQEPLNIRFQKFPWADSGTQALLDWQRGRTGIPLVDAGMRELWHTGWMHNRVRMVVASYLVKNLRIHWREGARWFWDTLVDADLANNTLGWQWVAGCGADAAPYFRIFNPVLQGERFDPNGDYVRRWVPELGKLPARHIHQPWQAPATLLQTCGVRLGVDYPHPGVDLKASREQALAAFKQLGGKDIPGIDNQA